MRRCISPRGTIRPSTPRIACGSGFTEYAPEGGWAVRRFGGWLGCVANRPTAKPPKRPDRCAADHRYHHYRERQRLRPPGRRPGLGRASREPAARTDAPVGDPAALAAEPRRPLRSRADGGERAVAAHPGRVSFGACGYAALRTGREARGSGRDVGWLEHTAPG